MRQTRDSRRAFGLPGSLFTDPEVFADETARIFRRCWLYAGHASRLRQPGDYLVCSAGSESAIVARGEDRVVRGFHNVCRHRGARLCDEAAGHFDAGTIRCPYHAWTYGLDGRLIAAPNMADRSDFDNADFPLRPVSASVWEGLVFVSFSSTPDPLEEFLRPLAGKCTAWDMPSLEVGHEIAYDIAANWKLLFQNYSECYHCPSLHPALNRLTPYRNSDNDLDEGPILGGAMRLSAGEGSMTVSGRRCAPPLAGVTGADLGRIHYYTLFPSLFLSLHPDFVLLHRLEPRGPDRTRLVCQWLFDPAARDAAEFEPGEAVEFWDLTNRQDWEICERTQRGVGSSGYLPGPYSNLESVVAAFDRHYLGRMERSQERGS